MGFNLRGVHGNPCQLPDYYQARLYPHRCLWHLVSDGIIWFPDFFHGKKINLGVQLGLIRGYCFYSVRSCMPVRI